MMQPFGRCPRCGYTLTYNGREYRCVFCGYASTRQPLPSMRNLERRLRLEIDSLLQRARKDQYQRMIVQYPYGSGKDHACGTCGLRIPSTVRNCPYCGALQRTTQTGLEPNAAPPTPQSGDQQVLDYITAHDGTISISQAAQDLSMSREILQLTIERLKAAGLLKPA